MAEQKKLSIIIITYQDGQCLERCVASIYQKFSGLESWEIIIVNNDPNQDVHHLPIDYSRVKLIDHKKNIGFSAGMNLGAKEAEGEFLLIFNPDTEVITDNVASVLNEFSQDDTIGIIGGGIVNKKNKQQEWSAGKEMSLYDLVRNNLGFSRSKLIWDSPEKISCDWVAGTVMFIKKDLFFQLGGFDENIFIYFEDMDLCRRVRQSGKKVVFFPHFKIFHISGESYTDKRLQKRDYYNSMEYYFRKNKGWWQFLAIKLARKILAKI